LNLKNIFFDLQQTFEECTQRTSQLLVSTNKKFLYSKCLAILFINIADTVCSDFWSESNVCKWVISPVNRPTSPSTF